MAYIHYAHARSGKSITAKKSCYYSFVDRMILSAVIGKDCKRNDPEEYSNENVSPTEFIDYLKRHDVTDRKSKKFLDVDGMFTNEFHSVNRLKGDNSLNISVIATKALPIFFVKSLRLYDLVAEYNTFKKYFTYNEGSYFDILSYIDFENNPRVFEVTYGAYKFYGVIDSMNDVCRFFIDITKMDSIYLDGKPYIGIGENGSRLPNDFGERDLTISYDGSLYKLPSLSDRNTILTKMLDGVRYSNTELKNNTNLYSTLYSSDDFCFSYSKENYSKRMKGMYPKQVLMGMVDFMFADSIISFSFDATGGAKPGGIGSEFFSNLSFDNRNNIIFLYAPITQDEYKDALLNFKLDGLLTGDFNIFRSHPPYSTSIGDIMTVTNRSTYICDPDDSVLADRSYKHYLLVDGYSLSQNDFLLDFHDRTIKLRSEIGKGLPPYSKHVEGSNVNIFR